MKNIGYIILAIITMAIISGIIKAIENGIKGANACKKYNKAIDNSNGLEKLRLILREGAITFSLGLTSHGDKKENSSGISFSILSTHMLISDIFMAKCKKSIRT